MTTFDDLTADFLRAEREALDRFCHRYRLGCTCGHCLARYTLEHANGETYNFTAGGQA